MFNFKKHSRFVTLFLFALLFIIGSGTACKPQKQISPPEKITIAYTETTGGALIQIAIAKGFFADEGLAVTSQPHLTGKSTLDAVIEGKADLASASDTNIMFAVMGGKKITTIAIIATSHKNMAMLARKDRGISRPVDLKGKKIGIVRGTISHFFADAFLSNYGIDRKQVTIIDLKAGEIASALATGRADAISIWQPVLINIQKDLSDKGQSFYGEFFYSFAFCMTALQDFAQRHPEAIRKILRALIKAETFSKQHPEESRDLMAKFVKTDKTFLDEIWDVYNYRVMLDQSFLINLEDQTRWALKNRLTIRRDMPNYLDFIYVDGLRAVKPEAVRIIR